MGNMSSENEGQDSGESEEQRLSKSARKRESASLQELGVKLSALPDQEIKALDLPENLFVALRDLRRLLEDADDAVDHRDPRFRPPTRKPERLATA